MAVMTGDDKERTSLGSFRMVGAFAGGMLVQGALLFLVAHFGNVDPEIVIDKLEEEKYRVTISAPADVENVNIKTEDGIARFNWDDSSISLIDQKKGYSNSMYIMAIFLTLFMFITFYTTKERVLPPKTQKNNLKRDLKDLVRNKPWLVLLVIGLLFNI